MTCIHKVQDAHQLQHVYGRKSELADLKATSSHDMMLSLEAKEMLDMGTPY